MHEKRGRRTQASGWGAKQPEDTFHNKSKPQKSFPYIDCPLHKSIWWESMDLEILPRLTSHGNLSFIPNNRHQRELKYTGTQKKKIPRRFDGICKILFILYAHEKETKAWSRENALLQTWKTERMVNSYIFNEINYWVQMAMPMWHSKLMPIKNQIYIILLSNTTPNKFNFKIFFKTQMLKTTRKPTFMKVVFMKEQECIYFML